MVSASVPVKGFTAALTVAFATITVWVLCGYVWPTLSNVEIGPLQAALDPSLFRNDFTVQESLRFTPRFYYNALILLPARAGLPLAWSVASWHVVALAALVSAVHSLRLRPFATAVLMVWLLLCNVGVLGSVFFFSIAPVPAVWAGAVAACGAACAVRGRYTAAFACFGGAAVLQFLVGFYAGLLALPILLREGRQQRVPALLAWAAGLALVYAPLTLAGRADAGALANDAFIEIYAHLRHPHHVVPSTWPMVDWLRTSLFYAGAWYFLHRTGSGRPLLERKLLHSTLALSIGALVVNYVFVEVVPIAFVAKLQPARITPLAQAVVLGLLATRIHAALEHRRFFLAALLAAIPFTLFPGPVLALAAILGSPERTKPGFSWPALLLAVSVALAFRGLDDSPGYQLQRYGPWLLPIAVLMLPHVLGLQRLPLVALVIGAGASAAHTASSTRQTAWSGLVFAPFVIDAAPADPPAILGRRFRERSDKDAIVLVPPTDEPWSFKLHAQRAVVVDNKNIAFTNAGLKEWHARMERVLGTPFVRSIDAPAAWRAQSPEKIAATAAHYGARHVLTRDEWHPVLPGRLLDRLYGWTLWELPPPAAAPAER